MANENKEIGDIVKKCKILLLDIEGTTTSISFVKDKLFPYAEENVKQFLDSQWDTEDVKEVVAALRKLALEDQESSVEGVVAIPGEDTAKEEQIEGLVKSVKWQMSADRKAGPLKTLQGLIWKQGYDSGDIKGHVFDDVSPALEQWRATVGQKVYIYSSGSVQAQKLLFGQSSAGDLLKFIDGHFDTAVGAKQEAKSYTNIVEKIGCKPEEVLFLTDIVKEAEAARSAGLYAALVSREGNAPLPAAAAAAFPVLTTLAELAVSYKRKPEQQAEEETPAKVPKTDVDEDVKMAAATESSTTEAPKEAGDAEKMEVEDAPAAEPVAKKEEVIIQEVEEPDEAAPVVEMEPIVEEITEEKETKTEEKQSTEESRPKPETVTKNGDVEAPVPEETPPVIEVEEVSEVENPAEVEKIELEPIVMEPTPGEDIEELQNVGDVLEKECDEILSKVQNVTNLDNIPVKPLLKTIAEENMETDNTDSNDIVDRILDTELDLEMKQCGDIDLNTVTDITKEAKTESGETKENEASPIEAKEVPKVEESSPTEAKVEGVKEQKVETKIKNNEELPKTEEKMVEVSDASGVANASENKVTEVTEEKSVESTPAEQKTETKEPQVTETKEPEATEIKEPQETDIKESQINGKTNGDAKVDMNGDVSNGAESRLTENGVNGANGDATEKGQGDCKVDMEATEIKVKTVTTDEPRTDPIEQPTEA